MPRPKGYKKTNVKPFGCECGESRPSMFYGDRKTECKRCANKRSISRYHKRQALQGIPSGPRKSGINPRESLKKPEPVYPPEEVALAAKFGLTVPQYREAKAER